MNRHTILKYILFALINSISGLVLAQDKPNVIIIYTDDQGSVDLNCYGSKDLLTPNMDKIAKSGVRFTQFYASPICSPSRATLLTGKNPQRAGLPGNTSATPNQTTGLSGTEYTMAEMFKDAGYKTAHIGKWHLGYTPEMSPNAQGFDYSFGHMVGCIYNYSHFYDNWINFLEGRLLSNHVWQYILGFWFFARQWSKFQCIFHHDLGILFPRKANGILP